jgi:two-component system, chemotaxis family, protein-glutamate methylesterase/glutaminase
MQGSVSALSLESNRQPRPGNIPVTCIGMSAGGMEPLKTIFRELPAESGMAFVVVHHIRKVPTLLPEILSTCTPMPVQLASGGLVVRPNHVYVLPSGTEVTLADSFFSVRSQSKHKGFSNVFTLLLKSLAKSNHRSVAVILSGVDADGAGALREFREHGGIVIAQEPDTAERPGMPTAAIRTGVVDDVLPPAAIAGRLEEIAQEFGSFSG